MKICPFRRVDREALAEDAPTGSTPELRGRSVETITLSQCLCRCGLIAVSVFAVGTAVLFYQATQILARGGGGAIRSFMEGHL